MDVGSPTHPGQSTGPALDSECCQLNQSSFKETTVGEVHNLGCAVVYVALLYDVIESGAADTFSIVA